MVLSTVISSIVFYYIVKVKIPIRPSNVLFNEYGSLKLCDFGLAKKIIDLVQVENNSETGVRITTKNCYLLEF